MGKLIADGTQIDISNEDADTTAYASATFQEVGEVTDFSYGGYTNPLIDMTDLKSSVREYETGISDSEDASITVIFDVTETGQLEVDEARVAKQKRWIKITFNDSSVGYFKALVTGTGAVTGSEGDKLSRDFTFKPLSEVTYA